MKRNAQTYSFYTVVTPLTLMKKHICTVNIGKITCRLVGFTAAHYIWLHETEL